MLTWRTAGHPRLRQPQPARDRDHVRHPVHAYQYNGRGERVGKALSTLSTEYAYDESGHLIGEYDGTGALQSEYIYLDDQPIALSTSGSRYYIETDQLGTPRQAIDPVRNVAVWSWDPLASTFGTNAPNTDPDGDGTKIAVNLRFPGQYADAETGLNYNLMRDYESSTGRYVESDPIGFRGGLVTYNYVMQNPMRLIDPTGEAAAVVPWNPGIIWPWIGPICTATNLGILVGVAIPNSTANSCSDEPFPPEGSCQDNADRCKKVRQSCVQGCSDFVLQKPRKNRTDWGSGGDFDRCVRQCMDRNGC